MIYFAGHGNRSADGKEGYWVLADGTDKAETWLGHTVLRQIISQMDATNILLVSDSCFSGLLTRSFRGIMDQQKVATTQNFTDYLQTKSVVSLSSGGAKPVLDVGDDGFTIFERSFARYLSNQNLPFTAQVLHQAITPIVAGTTRNLGYGQTPWIGNLEFEGHLGPDFIFIPR